MAHFKTRSKNSGWYEGRLMHPNPQSLSHMRPNTSKKQKTKRKTKNKETRAGNSYHNNSLKNYSKNLSWIKLHPPTKLSPIISEKKPDKTTNEQTNKQRIVFYIHLMREFILFSKHDLKVMLYDHSSKCHPKPTKQEVRWRRWVTLKKFVAHDGQKCQILVLIIRNY